MSRHPIVRCCRRHPASPAAQVPLQVADLRRFCRQVYEALGVPQADAALAADVLVAADLRGIPSHGVARLWRYVNGIRCGLMVPNAAMDIVRETPVSLVVDAHGGMGAPVSVRTMQRVIRKARVRGAAFAAVRDSNHFGIAGYYAMLALRHNMLGIAMTNTAALAVPTFGRRPMIGTNPLAFAAPAGRERAFVLDMSTTVVTRGKLEVYARAGRKLPRGWAVDAAGRPATDARRVLRALGRLSGGGLLPLGGAGEEFGGHKGYGLAVLVDILCGLLSGGPCGPDVRDTATSSARVGHFFAAIRVDLFRDPREFRRDMDRMLARLRRCPPAAGADRVYFAGQKELAHESQYVREGVPMPPSVFESLCDLGRELAIRPPRTA